MIAGPHGQRFDGLGTIGDVPLSSKLDGLRLVSAPMLLDPQVWSGNRGDAEGVGLAIAGGQKPTALRAVYCRGWSRKAHPVRGSRGRSPLIL